MTIERLRFLAQDKMTFNGSAWGRHEALPLIEEEQLGQLAFSFAARIVMHSLMGVEDTINPFEHALIKIDCISIDHLDAEAKEQGCRQHHKPTDLRVMRMGKGEEHKHGQIGQVAKHGMDFVAKYSLLASVFLPPGPQIL